MRDRLACRRGVLRVVVIQGRVGGRQWLDNRSAGATIGAMHPRRLLRLSTALFLPLPWLVVPRAQVPASNR